jgi:predicted Holliday junction resolvase-like endonuclease
MVKNMYDLAKEIIGAFAGNPWILLILITIVGIGYLIHLLIKNNAITTAIASRIADTETAQIIKDIRKDQIESNVERQEQTVAIEKIEKRLDKVETEIESLRCTRVACASRETD